MKKNLYIIAGCNGAGKTTASFTILPEILDCKEFVNADEIAKGLSPFQPEKVSFEAGRIMINRVNELLLLNENFAFETTLATKSYKSKVINAQKNNIRLLYYFFGCKTLIWPLKGSKQEYQKVDIILKRKSSAEDTKMELKTYLKFTFQLQTK